MEIQSFQYIEGKGFNVKKFPDLDSERTLILIFASPLFKTNPEPIQQLAKYYKKAKMLGCSTAGEIYGSKIYDKSMAITVIKFAHTTIQLAKAKVSEANESYIAGMEIAKKLQSPDLHCLFILSVGLNVNGSDLVKGLNEKTSNNVVITGGLAGDGPNFKKTWIISEGEILEDYAVAVGFYGDYICVGHASKGGWDIFGPERRITRSEGNILYELDHQPALALYKKYLGERAADLPSSGLLYPLAIRDPRQPKDASQLVRTILNIDEKENSLIFAGDVPLGYFGQLMHANFDRLIGSASEAGEIAQNLYCQSEDRRNLLAIDISCVGRRLLLGERAEEETEATYEILPHGSTQIGFYSYGELSPAGMRNCELHNQTMTITTLCERNN